MTVKPEERRNHVAIEPTMTIGGKPATSDDWVDVRNPADLKTVVGRYPNGSAAHAARKAYSI